MKYIKKFEARGEKLNQVETDAVQLSKLKEQWLKFEDEYPWDFNYFWNKINAYYDSINHYIKLDNSDIEVSLESEYSPYRRRDNDISKVFSSDIEWKKRNASISIYANTGGVSGGSCWDSSNPQEYTSDSSIEKEDLLKVIKEVLYGIFGRIKNPAGIGDVDMLMSKIENDYCIKEHEWTNYEYYGNSDDYRSYEISLWDLYKFIAVNDGF